MTVFNAFADKVECPRAACIWHDEPEKKGICHAKASPFPQATRDRWFEQYVAEENAIQGDAEDAQHD